MTFGPILLKSDCQIRSGNFDVYQGSPHLNVLFRQASYRFTNTTPESQTSSFGINNNPTKWFIEREVDAPLDTQGSVGFPVLDRLISVSGADRDYVSVLTSAGSHNTTHPPNINPGEHRFLPVGSFTAGPSAKYENDTLIFWPSDPEYLPGGSNAGEEFSITSEAYISVPLPRVIGDAPIGDVRYRFETKIGRAGVFGIYTRNSQGSDRKRAHLDAALHTDLKPATNPTTGVGNYSPVSIADIGGGWFRWDLDGPGAFHSQSSNEIELLIYLISPGLPQASYKGVAGDDLGFRNLQVLADNVRTPISALVTTYDTQLKEAVRAVKLDTSDNEILVAEQPAFQNPNINSSIAAVTPLQVSHLSPAGLTDILAFSGSSPFGQLTPSILAAVNSAVLNSPILTSPTTLSSQHVRITHPFTESFVVWDNITGNIITKALTNTRTHVIGDNLIRLVDFSPQSQFAPPIKTKTSVFRRRYTLPDNTQIVGNPITYTIHWEEVEDIPLFRVRRPLASFLVKMDPTNPTHGWGLVRSRIQVAPPRTIEEPEANEGVIDAGERDLRVSSNRYKVTPITVVSECRVVYGEIRPMRFSPGVLGSSSDGLEQEEWPEYSSFTVGTAAIYTLKKTTPSNTYEFVERRTLQRGDPVSVPGTDITEQTTITEHIRYTGPFVFGLVDPVGQASIHSPSRTTGLCSIILHGAARNFMGEHGISVTEQEDTIISQSEVGTFESSNPGGPAENYREVQEAGPKIKKVILGGSVVWESSNSTAEVQGPYAATQPLTESTGIKWIWFATEDRLNWSLFTDQGNIIHKILRSGNSESVLEVVGTTQNHIYVSLSVPPAFQTSVAIRVDGGGGWICNPIAPNSVVQQLSSQVPAIDQFTPTDENNEWKYDDEGEPLFDNVHSYLPDTWEFVGWKFTPPQPPVPPQSN